jgi:hypothetical protein
MEMATATQMMARKTKMMPRPMTMIRRDFTELPPALLRHMVSA